MIRNGGGGRELRGRGGVRAARKGKRRSERRKPRGRAIWALKRKGWRGEKREDLTKRKGRQRENEASGSKVGFEVVV